MFIMAKSSSGVFLKITHVTADHGGTIYDLRQSVTSAFNAIGMGDKKFVLLMETMSDIVESKEKKLKVAQVYSSDCVLIRWIKDQASRLSLCS